MHDTEAAPAEYLRRQTADANRSETVFVGGGPSSSPAPESYSTVFISMNEALLATRKLQAVQCFENAAQA
jgi:hypothetical protein